MTVPTPSPFPSAPSSPVPEPPPDGIVAALRSAGCVFAEEEAELIISAARTPSELAALVTRRIAGSPLEHVLGWAEFCGLRIAVEDSVFVPRRRTELVVRRAAALAGPGAVVVDLCCGSGAVAAALAAILDDVDIHAVDVDPAAVRCARRNLAGPGSHVYQGDLYDALPGRLRGRVDVLVANPPYVPTDAIALLPPEARTHEPRTALDGGPDGLDVLRRVAAEAPEWLVPGGHLVLELGAEQVPAAVEAIARNGLLPEVGHDDDVGGTVLVGRWGPAQ